MRNPAEEGINAARLEARTARALESLAREHDAGSANALVRARAICEKAGLSAEETTRALTTATEAL